MNTRHRIVAGRDLNDRMIRGMMSVDASVYPSEILSPTIALSWLARNPDIYTVVLDAADDHVCGYVNAMPIADGYFRELESGNVDDAHIPARAIRLYDAPGVYKMWICSIAMAPAYQCTRAYTLLLDAFTESLIGLAARGIFVSEIMCDAITMGGERLAERAGLRPVVQSPRGTWIYHGSLLPPKILLPSSNSDTLRALYERKHQTLMQPR